MSVSLKTLAVALLSVLVSSCSLWKEPTENVPKDPIPQSRESFKELKEKQTGASQENTRKSNDVKAENPAVNVVNESTTVSVQ